MQWQKAKIREKKPRSLKKLVLRNKKELVVYASSFCYSIFIQRRVTLPSASGKIILVFLVVLFLLPGLFELFSVR